MINFFKLRWKNFLSTGDVFTEIDLTKTQNTLIIGSNGAGKSTILDALTFVLFGKPFRKINKPSLVNTVNQKNCIVEIEFTNNKKQYKVVRGIKPNVFDIWQDGICLNQASATKDYQEYLEKFILKMNYKSFTQIVILGSASFTPFMQLSAADRRAVIEDLLDIQIFSVMNTIAKQQLSDKKEEAEINKVKLVSSGEQKKYIDALSNRLNEDLNKKNEEIAERVSQLNIEIVKMTNTIEQHELELKGLKEDVAQFSDRRKRHSKLLSLQAKIKANYDHYNEEIDFYEKHETCPTCSQQITEKFKEAKSKLLNNKTDELSKGLSKISDEIHSVEKDIEKCELLEKHILTLEKQILSIESIIKGLRKEKLSLTTECKSIDNNDLITKTFADQLSINNNIVQLELKAEELSKEKVIIETAISLLKDGGIKTKIIKQYLPIINKQINKYLMQMGFLVDFNIDETFNETIKSRYRDTFSYENFSQGEKMRIDLAVLFTWRAIAKMRNSVNTNLLIMDEIFDSSLDSSGTDEFLKIMWNLTSDTNVFVISHKQDQLLDKFQRVLEFRKQRNFSRLV